LALVGLLLFVGVLVMPQSGSFLAATAVVCLVAIPMPWLIERLVTAWLEIDLHEGGLRVRRRLTGDEQTVSFDDVDDVLYDIADAATPGLARTRLVLVLVDGSRVVVPRYLTDVRTILRAVDDSVVRPLIAPARNALSAGERLYFGPLVLESEGLRVDGALFSWVAIGGIDIGPREIVIRAWLRDRRMASLRTRWIPHVRVLAAVLAETSAPGTVTVDRSIGEA
jgi:hypothetical protein